MSKTLIVGSETFEFPEEGENGNYGEQITDWAEAVSTALLTVQARNDIPLTTAVINNNATVTTPISGFLFDTSEVISINGEYIVSRSTAVPAVNIVESGTIKGNFNGTSWTIVHSCVGDAGIDFDITSAGQITYISTNMTGTDYAGQVLFKAKVFNQTEE